MPRLTPQSWTVEKLPLADIIAINVDHYRLDADYKQGLHFSALPAAWASGFRRFAGDEDGITRAIHMDFEFFRWFAHRSRFEVGGAISSGG